MSGGSVEGGSSSWPLALVGKERRRGEDGAVVREKGVGNVGGGR
jgi:hypothetical protein